MHSNPNPTNVKVDYEYLVFNNSLPQSRKWLCNVKGCKRRFKNKRHWEQHFIASHYREEGGDKKIYE